MSSAETLHFPSKGEIVSYLEQHPLTNDPYLTEKKIIEAVADFFADKDKAPMGVDMGVMLKLADLNEKLQLPQHLTHYSPFPAKAVSVSLIHLDLFDDTLSFC
ncbi:hypothetical protein JTE90_007397 [Oedothorax gibbosus]|uniref:Uncharacterized protein n=1 Tax=Oedothorax gibbosus TaxID=931172 RepID=A0AAV6TIM1_9ARAC|nr:hypothetical protein JTE90_007397 [Oedothorax gibbosus]